MENIENVKILQNIAKDFNILFVEDSRALQKQVVMFLTKFFKNVYVASDGVEGIVQYKEFKPDLILTDLTMPILNGHDMIREIKKINADVEIIILSAHSDPETLMTSFHIGVSDFIQKPINAPKMINVLLKVLSNIKRKKEQIESVLKNDIKLEENGIELDDNDIVTFIFESDLKLDLINYYRGIPIINNAKIIEITNDEILIKTSFIQLMAIKHEGLTILDSNEVNKNILCSLISLDMDKYIVKVKKEEVFFPNSKHRNLSKVEPDEFIKAILLKDDKEIPIKVLTVSEKEIVFKINEQNISLSKHDNMDIYLFCNNEKILLQTTIFKKEKTNKAFIIASFIKSLAKTEDSLKKYIYKREQELLDEFKNLYLSE
jgi:YesN/AraC family two-component response regulator